MLEQLEKEQPIFYKQAIIPIQEKKINHAYLLETNNLEEKKVSDIIEMFLFTLFSNTSKQNESGEELSKLKHLIHIRNYPDLIEVKPENNIIKKEQLKSVMHQFQEKSAYDTCQVYIVYEADKLNTSAANTILKFLEEPEENIIALFITNNRYKIINTILSRCSILSLINKIPEETLSLEDSLLDFINDIKERKASPLLLNFKKYNEGILKDKATAEQNLILLKEYYKSKLDQKDESLTLIECLKIIEIITQSLEKLRYNVNMKLWQDRLLLELTEV